MRTCLYCLVVFATCVASKADTFTHHTSGDSFNGHCTNGTKGNKTLVHIEGKSPQYLDLSQYDVRYNYLGRKDKVIVISITDEIELMCETEALNKAITVSANQGPLFIILEIDTPGGRLDLTKSICETIQKTNTCKILAFVKGGKFGGAYSAGAYITLACDSVYMASGTAIGAAASVLSSKNIVMEPKEVLGETMGAKLVSADSGYIAALAQRKGRPGLIAAAMANKDIEVLEVTDNNKCSFVRAEDKTSGSNVVRTWNKKGALLTLTPEEAVHCGIADKVVSSQRAMLTALDATQTSVVFNTDSKKAKNEFVKTNKRVDDFIDSISILEKHVSTLIKEIAQLDATISRTEGVIRRPDGYGGTVIYQERYNSEARYQFDSKTKECSQALRQLRYNCGQAILVAEKHPDLQDKLQIIESSAKFAQTADLELQARLK
jgi:ATP-dependent protease ClpP protease subunit